MGKYIIGTKFVGHDTNVAVINENGQIVTLAEEERFDRIKHSSNFPVLAIQEAVERYGINVNDVAYIATPFCHELFYDRIDHMKTYFKKYKSFDEKKYKHLKSYEFDYIQQYLFGVLYLEKLFPNATVVDVRHHLTHAASAFYCSPFNEAAILSVDANGEIETTFLGRGEHEKIEELESVEFPNTLGFLYEYVSEWLGLGRLEGPGKTMGLSAYGKPRYLDIFFEKVIHINEFEGRFQINPALISECPPPLMNINYLTDIFGKDARMVNTSNFDQFQADIAATIQAISEKVVVSLARRLKKLTGSKYLCISGGVALNCLANGKIHDAKIFEDIFIQPAANDSGSGLGAALYVYHDFLKQKTKHTNTTFHPYTGSSFSSEEIESTLLKNELPIKRIENIEEWAAEKLSNGLLLGWFQGAMEIGPRALGNRSILADPTKAENKDLLNARVKYREWWRPFAPIVLFEYSKCYFDLNIEAPYMLIIAKMLTDNLPAISHIDKTARVQTLRSSQNPRLYKLIKHFQQITGVPVILNTSFNIRSEPLVRTPQEALNCLFREGLDAVVLGNYVVLKSDLEPARHRAIDVRLTERIEYDQFIAKKKQEIEKEASSIDNIVAGTDAYSRLVFIEALKAGKHVVAFKNGGRPYLDTLGRQTLFGIKVNK